MVVRKFYGNNTREALRQVRDALGPDALILSNRQMPGGGIEIMAVADTDVAMLTSGSAAPTTHTNTAAPSPVNPTEMTANSYRSNRQNDRQAYQPEQPSQNLSPSGYQRPDWPQVARPRGQQPKPTYGDEPFLISHNRPAAPSYTEQHTGERHGRMNGNGYDYTNEAAYASPSEREPSRQAAPPSYDPAPYEAPRYEDMPTYRGNGNSGNGNRYVAPELFEQPARSSNARANETPASDAISPATEAILQEVKMLRALVESQLAGFAWGDLTQHHPEKLEMLRRLLAAGFSPRLSRELLDRLPDNLTPDAAGKWVKNALFHNLKATTPDNELVDRGGIFALVGPTGVGKTTTVAKLAARFSMRYGSDEVALISTDSYRIGAHDQLRIYGKILNIPVLTVKDEDDLQLTLADLASKRFVLIDTVGMSQRDQRVIEQTNMLAGRGLPISRILLLAANTHAATLDDVVRRYIGEQRQSLTHCILTKIDEATSLGAAIDAMLRHRLTLCYVTNGQRVPEDLHLANPLYLLDRAFKNQADSDTFALKSDEYPLFMAAQPSPQQPDSVTPSVRRSPRDPIISASVLRSNRK